MTFASLVHPRLDVIPQPRTDRWGKAAIAFLVLLGLAALGGGVLLVVAPDGGLMQWDVSMLAGSPFGDFLVPGLILGGLFGLGSIVTAILGIRHSRLAPFLAFAIGVGQMIWIVVELAVLGDVSFLHPTMFAIGLVIAGASVPWGWSTFRGWRRA